MGSKDRCQ